MPDRVVEIINILIREILHAHSSVPTAPELVETLVGRGYELAEIGRAFELIYALPDGSHKAEQSTEAPMPRRAFNVLETIRVRVDVRNHLIRLRENNFLNSDEFEQVMVLLLQNEEAGPVELTEALYQVVSDPVRVRFLSPPDLAGDFGTVVH